MQKVTADYDGVWVFAKAGAVSDAFERAMSELAPELRATVRMLPLETLEWRASLTLRHISHWI